MVRWILAVVLVLAMAPAAMAGTEQPLMAQDDYAFLPDYLPYVVVDVLRNDGGPARAERLVVDRLLQVTHGYAFILRDGQVLFWWAPGMHGGGMVQYLVRDGRGREAKATVWIECCALEGSER